MNDTRSSQPERAPSEVRQLVQDVAQGLQLRRELIELEIRHNVRSVRRLLVGVAIGAVLTLVGLPVLLHVAAELLSRVTALDAIQWAALLALLVVLPGATILAVAIRRFRRDYSGFRHSLAELQEDLVWLREWLGAAAPAEAAPAAEQSGE